MHIKFFAVFLLLSNRVFPLKELLKESGYFCVERGRILQFFLYTKTLKKLPADLEKSPGIFPPVGGVLPMFG